MLLTQYDLRTSFSSPRKEGARATSDKQRATDFEECPSVDHIISYVDQANHSKLPNLCLLSLETGRKGLLTIHFPPALFLAFLLLKIQLY